MSAVGLTAKNLHVDPFKGKARKDGHTMISLLSTESRVLVAKPLKALEREGVIGTFRLLQA
jgi:hypothetical protein